MQAMIDAGALDWRYIHHVMHRLAMTFNAFDPETFADLATMILLEPRIQWQAGWIDEYKADWGQRLMDGTASTPKTRKARRAASAWIDVQMRKLDAMGRA
jgi:hypothetical protein